MHAMICSHFIYICHTLTSELPTCHKSNTSTQENACTFPSRGMTAHALCDVGDVAIPLAFNLTISQETQADESHQSTNWAARLRALPSLHHTLTVTLTYVRAWSGGRGTHCLGCISICSVYRIYYRRSIYKAHIMMVRTI